MYLYLNNSYTALTRECVITREENYCRLLLRENNANSNLRCR